MHSTITESETNSTLMVKAITESFHLWQVMMEREISSKQLLFGKDQNGRRRPENNRVCCYITIWSYAEPCGMYSVHSSVKVKVNCRNCALVHLTFRSVLVSQGHTCLQVRKNLKLRNRERGNAIRRIKISLGARKEQNTLSERKCKHVFAEIYETQSKRQ